MQSELYLRRCGDIECNPLTTIQAERLRIAADMKIKKEARHANPNLRRTLAHVLVLESLDIVQDTLLRQPPPTYSDSVPIQHETTACDDFVAPVPDLDEDAEPDADSETDSSEYSSEDEPTFDDEFDTDHALLRIPSWHSLGSVHQARCEKPREVVIHRGPAVLNSQHWTKPAVRDAEDGDSGSLVVASVVEVSDWDD